MKNEQPTEKEIEYWNEVFSEPVNKGLQPLPKLYHNNMNAVYISGKISGLKKLAVVEKFETAERLLMNFGYAKIINPAKLDHSGNTLDDYDLYMKTDIKAMMECNTIFMLPCWRDSKGAKIELQLAIQLNYNIIWGE